MPLSLDVTEDIKQFKDITHQLQSYNEIYNLNNFLKQQTFEDERRIRKTNDNLKSQILKLRQQYLGFDYQKNMTAVRNNILYITLITFSLLFIVGGLTLKQTINIGMMSTIVGVISVCYMFIVMYFVMANKSRKQQGFNQFYWDGIKSS